MNFNFERQDLLRHGAPGFVFLLVCFSFHSSDFISLFSQSSRLGTMVFFVIAGFTVGYLIQSLYRGTWASSDEDLHKREGWEGIVLKESWDKFKDKAG